MARPTKRAEVSEKQKIKNQEKKDQKNKELEEYKNRYKTILWIDDDCGNKLEDNLDWLKTKSGLKNIKDSFNVRTVKYFYDAVIEIDTKPYDLVIFDINLEKGFKGPSAEKEKSIEEIFNRERLIFKYNDFIENESNRKTAGEYLYLLLLKKRYPQNRMVIYTNNYSEFQKDSMLSKAKLFNFEDDNLFVSKDDGIDIDYYFTNDEEYYRVRRLIYQAYDFWKKKYENIDIIPFNDIYKLNDEKCAFFDMLSQIKQAFPIDKPENPEEICYQAMHTVSMFHEEKADISKISIELLPYHQMVRNFRNWSSHKKFKNNQDSDKNNYKFSFKQFAFLFCVALRTYFDQQKYAIESISEYHLYDDTYYYEDGYFGNPQELEWNKVNDIIHSVWVKMIGEVCFYGGRRNKEYLLKNADLPTLLQRLGEQKTYDMPFYYIFLSMFKSPNTVSKDHRIPEQIMLDSDSITLDDDGFVNVCVKFNYKLKWIDEVEYKSRFKHSNVANSFFEKIAFDLISENHTT